MRMRAAPRARGDDAMGSVGKNLPHDSAAGHVTGESIYIDDIPPLCNGPLVALWWAPVSLSLVPSGALRAAATVPGLAGLYTWKDLHANQFGPILHDETLLAEDRAMFMGHPVVVIGGESREALR